MQQCGICLKVYDESEYSHCPYCDGLLYDEDDDDFEDEDEDYVEDEKMKEFHRLLDCPGVYDEDGEFVRCPNCGMGLRDDNGVITCPECGPV